MVTALQTKGWETAVKGQIVNSLGFLYCILFVYLFLQPLKI